MFPVPISYPPILVSSVLYMGLGMVWYGPLFQKSWVKLNGFEIPTDKIKMKEMQKKAIPAYVVSFVFSLITAGMLGFFTRYMGAIGPLDGALVGFLCWLAFAGPHYLTICMYTQKPLKLWAIDSGYFLVSLMMMGAIMASWK